MGRKHSFMVGSLFIVQVPVLNECLQTFLRSFGVRVTEFVMRTRDAGLCRGPATPGSLDVPAGSSETELPSARWRAGRPPRRCSPQSTCRSGSRTCKGKGTAVWNPSALLHFKERAESIILFRAHNLEFALYIAIQFVFLKMSQSFNLSNTGLSFFFGTDNQSKCIIYSTH